MHADPKMGHLFSLFEMSSRVTSLSGSPSYIFHIFFYLDGSGNKSECFETGRKSRNFGCFIHFAKYEIIRCMYPDL